MDFNDYLSQGAAFFQEGKIAQAIESFEEALKIQPGNEQLCQMIETMKQQMDAASASRQLNAEEAKQRAKILGITVADVDKAIAEYTQALKRSPNDDSAKQILASSYYIRGLTLTSYDSFSVGLNIRGRRFMPFSLLFSPPRLGVMLFPV